YIALGISQIADVDSYLLSVDKIDWQVLANADAIVFGCPTYMGCVSAPFKTFMDDTSKVWLEQSWQGKLAAGFTNSGGLSGDKLAVLQQIQLFAMQHGMLWAGMPLMPTGTQPEDLNRMGSYIGLMAQSDSAPVDVTPPVGDLRTAEWFGQHIAKTVQRIIN
ncbi:MAG TPA: flavodoxin family protein, partial [Agitococcus sp.]|nr:flavodoxin family protein [Agitococcus sp.]